MYALQIWVTKVDHYAIQETAIKALTETSSFKGVPSSNQGQVTSLHGKV